VCLWLHYVLGSVILLQETFGEFWSPGSNIFRFLKLGLSFLDIFFPPGPTRQPLLSLPTRPGPRISRPLRLPRASAAAHWPAARRASFRARRLANAARGGIYPTRTAALSSPPRLKRHRRLLPNPNPPLPLPPAAASPSARRRIPPPPVSPRPIGRVYTTPSSSSFGSDRPPPLPKPAAPFPTRSFLRRRRALSRRHSPPHPARPCHGRAPPLRRAACARAAPARSRPPTTSPPVGRSGVAPRARGAPRACAGYAHGESRPRLALTSSGSRAGHLGPPVGAQGR
jgi:hypothetical protein